MSNPSRVLAAAMYVATIAVIAFGPDINLEPS